MSAAKHTPVTRIPTALSTHDRARLRRSDRVEPIAYLYQHDETGRTTLRMASERMSEPRWHEYPLYLHPVTGSAQ